MDLLLKGETAWKRLHGRDWMGRDWMEETGWKRLGRKRLDEKRLDEMCLEVTSGSLIHPILFVSNSLLKFITILLLIMKREYDYTFHPLEQTILWSCRSISSRLPIWFQENKSLLFISFILCLYCPASNKTMNCLNEHKGKRSPEKKGKNLKTKG